MVWAKRFHIDSTESNDFVGKHGFWGTLFCYGFHRGMYIGCSHNHRCREPNTIFACYHGTTERRIRSWRSFSISRASYGEHL